MQEQIPNEIEIVVQKNNPIRQHLKQNYQKMGKIRVTFKLEAIAIPNSNKIQYFFEADQKLLAVKQRLDSETKKKFYFYLNQSFMPSFDATIGDLAQSYGKYDSNKGQFQIQLIASDSENRYG